MTREPLISVIVPVYNVEAYLPRCVDSILSQTYRNLEVILVDDGSKDSGGRICDAYAAKDARITVIHKENGGLSSARNAGVDIARGEYLAFVDSDDWIEPETYETMLALAEKHGTKLVVAGRYDVSSATGEKTVGLCPRAEEVISTEELVGRIFLWDGCDSAAWDKLYHRSLFAQFRYPHGVVSEDVAVTYRILLQTDRAALCPVPVYNYFHRPNSITTASVSEKSFHFSRHTAVIYEEIRKNYPAIEPRARHFRVKSLSHILLLLDQADAGTREKFAAEYRAAKKELGTHWGFFLKCPWLTKQEKVTDLLLVLGLYRTLRPIFHR